jgi:hypothetical protein
MRSFYEAGQDKSAEIEKAGKAARPWWDIKDACSAFERKSRLFLVVVVIFVPVAYLHAFLGVLDRFAGRLQSSRAMSAFVVFGHIQVLLGLFQGIESGLHVRLIIIIGRIGKGDRRAEQCQHHRDR